MSSFGRDISLALRGLARRPGFALAAVATLSLAVGANTAIFSVVHAVLLRPLPFPRAERLVRLEERHGDGSRLNLTGATYRDLRSGPGVLAHVAVFREYPFNLSGEGRAEPVTVARVSADFFAVLGVSPVAGRLLAPEEFGPGAERVAVLAEGLCRRWFGGSGAAVGRRVRLDGEEYLVAGILPERLRFPEDVDVWLPLTPEGELPGNRHSHLFTSLARLADGVSLVRARQELAARATTIRAESGAEDDLRAFAVTPLRERLTEGVRPALLALLGAVGLLLLVACVNLASLLLARGTRRAREMAIRGALGASRWRVTRQVMTESLVLALLGSVPGTLLAFAATRGLRLLVPVDVPRIGTVGVDPGVLAFALLLSVAAAVVFGAAPALQAARADLRGALVAGARALGPTRTRARGGLVVAEVALVVVLLGGAGLLSRTFLALQSVPLGFRTDRVLTFYVSPGGPRYDSASGVVGFTDEVMRRLQGLAAVERVAVASAVPTGPLPSTSFAVEGRDPGQAEGTPGADVVAVSPDYFRLLGVPVLRGRPIEETDGLAAEPVVVVSEQAARLFWPGQDPLQRRLTLLHWDEPLEARVVGVVADLREHGPSEEPAPIVYFSQRQFADRVLGWHFFVRTRSDPRALAASVRDLVRGVDPSQPVAALSSFEDVLSRALAAQRFNAALVGLFAALALALTAVGIYGVVSWTVSERYREIGVRLAFGAPPRAVVRQFTARALRLTSFGLLLGLPAALVGGRALAGLLYGVGPADPATMLGVAALVLAVGLGAAVVPARRAASVDPLASLREE